MVVALVAVLAGLTAMVVAGMSHRRDVGTAMDDLLGMRPIADEDEEPRESSALADRAVDLAGQVVERVDTGNSLRETLERARVPLRPGEFVIVAGGAALGVAAMLTAATHSLPVAVGGGVMSVVVAFRLVKRRIAKRRKAFEAQLPDALSLVASSLTAGHTFLRAIQMMCEESGPPMSEEFGRVVAETRLGDPLVDALGRMSAKLQIRDMDMVVQAIRIQQTIGGRLADLLHTLAEFIRARDEVRREVKILTAQGRMSAYVLAVLVPFLFLMMRMLNPTYVQPLYHGWGLGLLIGCGTSVLLGMLVILRMVKIEV